MIVISDLHIGRGDCQIDALEDFIWENPTETLVLNGDILDQFAMFKDFHIFRQHRPKVERMWRLLKERKTKIIYLVGNHDYLMFLLAPIGFLWGLRITKRYVTKELHIEHGDWITYYLKARGFRTGTYPENCELFAIIKGKILVVGHSHEPQRTWRVIDVGDWVGHNTYWNTDDP